MNKIKFILVFSIALLFAITIMGIFLSSQSHAAAKRQWDLELDKETNEISKNDFKSWMAKKGFESFKK